VGVAADVEKSWKPRRALKMPIDLISIDLGGHAPSSTRKASSTQRVDAINKAIADGSYTVQVDRIAEGLIHTERALGQLTEIRRWTKPCAVRNSVA
jgi:anti-sigma28 factor (negative regulator of flagellin synthesis)